MGEGKQNRLCVCVCVRSSRLAPACLPYLLPGSRLALAAGDGRDCKELGLPPTSPAETSALPPPPPRCLGDPQDPANRPDPHPAPKAGPAAASLPYLAALPGSPLATAAAPAPAARGTSPIAGHRRLPRGDDRDVPERHRERRQRRATAWPAPHWLLLLLPPPPACRESE